MKTLNNTKKKQEQMLFYPYMLILVKRQDYKSLGNF